MPWYQGQQLTVGAQLEAYKQCTTRLIEGPFESWAALIDSDEYLFAQPPPQQQQGGESRLYGRTPLSQVLSGPTFAGASAVRLSWTYLNNFAQWWEPKRLFGHLHGDAAAAPQDGGDTTTNAERQRSDEADEGERPTRRRERP